MSLMKAAVVLLLCALSFQINAVEVDRSAASNKPTLSFFDSHARDPFARTASLVSPPENKPAPAQYYRLALSGVFGATAKRTVLIGGQMIAEGDSAVVKIGDKTIKVVCKEIQEEFAM